jgi:hypothetical protein
VRGDLTKACFMSWSSTDAESIGHLTALPVIVKGPLDVSSNGDDTIWPRHLYDDVDIMWDQMNLESVSRPKKAL